MLYFGRLRNPAVRQCTVAFKTYFITVFSHHFVRHAWTRGFQLPFAQIEVSGAFSKICAVPGKLEISESLANQGKCFSKSPGEFLFDVMKVWAVVNETFVGTNPLVHRHTVTRAHGVIEWRSDDVTKLFYWNYGFCSVVLNDLYEKGSQSKKWLFSAPNSWDMGF